MNNRDKEITLKPFLYTFLMDAIQLQKIDYPQYAQKEPGYAEAFFQAYIKAFQAPRDGKISQDLIKQINRLSMQHMSKKCGEYRTNNISFKLSREIHEFSNGTIGENICYSSTEEGLNEFIEYWFLNQTYPKHTLFFQKDGESQFHRLQARNQTLFTQKDGCSSSILKTEARVAWIKKWFHSDYRCTIIIDEDNAYITDNMQNILEEYHRDIPSAASDHDKIRVIAKYIQRIEQLHPFPDGNIRTCYILLNKLLSDYGLPLTILLNPNRLDCCELNEIIRSIQEGQLIYQRLMNNQDPEKFVMPLGKPILDNIHHISVSPHDLHMPELVSSFCAWVLDRPSAGFLNQFQHGFFTFPKQPVVNALHSSIVPYLETLAPSKAQELICNIFETINFSLLLRRACLIGQYDIIKTLLSFRLLLSIDINEPSKKGYTALDYLEKHPASATKKDMIELLHCHGAGSHTEVLRALELK